MRRNILRLAVPVGAKALMVISPSPALADHGLEVAMRLAKMLQSARTVISVNQGLINDASVDDKKLTGRVVVDAAAKFFDKSTG
jgi:hypothetical protein